MKQVVHTYYQHDTLIKLFNWLGEYIHSIKFEHSPICQFPAVTMNLE